MTEETPTIDVQAIRKLANDLKATWATKTTTDPNGTPDEPVPTPDAPLPPRPALIHPDISGLSLEKDPAWRERILRIDETYHPKVAKLALWAEWFSKFGAANDRTKGQQIVIAGTPGSGKTHALKRVKRWFESHKIDMYVTGHWSSPPTPLFIDWGRLMEQREDWPWEDALAESAAAGVVLIDDVGSEVDKFKSGQNTSRLRQMLSACEKKWLLLTTNVTREDWTKVYDERVADRLSAAHYLDMTGVPSYRPNMKGANA